MTPKKPPTIAELNREAQRIDPNAWIETDRTFGRRMNVWTAPIYLRDVSDTPKARRFILAGLRTLPSAQKKGTKRCRK